MTELRKDFKVETFIQTLPNGEKRIIVDLYKTTIKKVKTFFLDIKKEDFNK